MFMVSADMVDEEAVVEVLVGFWSGCNRVTHSHRRLHLSLRLHKLCAVNHSIAIGVKCLHQGSQILASRGIKCLPQRPGLGLKAGVLRCLILCWESPRAPPIRTTSLGLTLALV